MVCDKFYWYNRESNNQHDGLQCAVRRARLIQPRPSPTLLCDNCSWLFRSRLSIQSFLSLSPEGRKGISREDVDPDAWMPMGANLSLNTGKGSSIFFSKDICTKWTQTTAIKICSWFTNSVVHPINYYGNSALPETPVHSQ